MIQRVGVLLKTKKHIKAYLISNFGEFPVIDSKSIFHNHFLFCLAHRLLRDMDKCIEYTESCKLYITRDDYERYGCWLNKKQAHLFNEHVDTMMKSEIVIRIQMHMEYNEKATLNSAILDSLKRMGLTDEDWNPESIVRYYHRYRQRKGMPLLYDKKINKSSEKMSD